MGSLDDAVYASLSPVLDSTALFLGQFDCTSGLASGASYTQTQAVAFPPCWSGNYYIYVAADAGNRVNGTACVVNNQGRSTVPLTVNVGAHPDLVVSTVGIPGTAYAGQPMSVSWTVTNAGSATANGPWLDSVYLSPSGTLNSGNRVFLGSYAYNGSLAAGAAYNQTTAFTLPNTTHGNFYVFVVTDSTNAVNECQGENNNVTGSSSLVNVPVTLYPDLKASAVQVPGSAYAGQTVNISWIVTNQGTDATPSSTVWNDAVFLSKDQVLDPRDTRLGTFARPSSLGVGQSYTNSVTVQIPAGAAGPYYVLVLADSGGSLFEYLGYNDSLGWNPSAMIVSLPATADLAATSVTLDPAAGVPGDTVSIGWSVRNVSSNNIPSTWTDAAYLSTNSFWDINAMEVARHDHSGLASSSSYSDSWTGPLAALTPGLYHAVVRTDVRNTVRETNLVNNVAASANTIAVDVPVLTLGQPVTNQLSTGAAQYYKFNVPAGQTVRLTLIGASTNSANQLFIRYGAVPDLGNYDFLYNNPLSPNQQIEIPTTQAGWYYVMVRGENEPGGPLAYTLEADIVPFAISSISQNHIGDNGQVTITLSGAQFQSGATVQLVSGTNIYYSQTNFFIDATSVKARFVFTNAVHGIYDVVLTNPDSKSTAATQAVSIETALPLAAQVVPGLFNSLPRAGSLYKWKGTVYNVGNVDIQYLAVNVFTPQQLPIVLNPPSSAVFAITNSTENTAGGCAFTARDVAPAESLDFSFAVSGFGSQGFSYYIVPAVQSKQDFLGQILGEATTLRDYILASTNIFTQTTTNSGGGVTTNMLSLPPEVAAALAGSNTWVRFVVAGLAGENLLDTNDLASSSLQTRALVLAPISSLRKDSSSACTICSNSAYTASLADARFQATEIMDCPPCLVHILAQSAALEAIILVLEHICLCANNCVPSSECGGPLPCPAGMMWLQCAFPGPGACYPGCVPIPQTRDPNGKVGPAGYSGSRVVGLQRPWDYTVYFENVSNATAYARQIRITDSLDPSLDIHTFRLSEIAFGNLTITVPANRSFYQTRIAAPYPNPTNIVVDVTAGIDVQNGIVSLTLNAIDLTTGQLVESADHGVLPPNTTNHIGEGHITYTIKPKSSVPTGTVVTNQAAIVFDTNDPINTNPTTNTVDALPPSSSVIALPSSVLTTNFTVSWFGTDDAGGSGVQNYDIYLSDNGGPWQTWLSGAAQNSAAYSGQPGHYYYFYSIAHDNSGNVESAPSSFQAMTLVSTNQPPTPQPIPDQTVSVGRCLVITNVASDPNGLQTLTFGLQDSPSGAIINPTNGIFSWCPSCAQGSTTNLITVWTGDNGTPPMSNSMSFLVIVPECIEAALGNAVVLAGQTSSVPVRLLSTTALTNMAFTVVYPPERFATNFTLEVNSPQVLTQQWRLLDSGQVQLSFTLPAASVLHGPTNVGQLIFTAFSNQSSAFVPLPLADVSALKPDGSPAAKAYGQPGRVVVVGAEPLLEAAPSAGQNVWLTLYGQPNSNYLFEWKTNLLDGAWQTGWSTMMASTNLWQTLEVPATNPAEFFRALRP
jgi:hypothetical protein